MGVFMEEAINLHVQAAMKMYNVQVRQLCQKFHLWQSEYPLLNCT